MIGPLLYVSCEVDDGFSGLPLTTTYIKVPMG